MVAAPNGIRVVVDTNTWSKRDMWRLSSGEMAVRPGLRKLYSRTDRKFVGGFSVRNEYIDEVIHYIFDVDDDDDTGLRLTIYDENFERRFIYEVGTNGVPRVITHAVIQGQILICSPDFPTIWGLVGAGVRLAEKVASDDLTTTAIAVPRGIVSAFCNRAVIADGRSMFFSDPIAVTGGDMRTFVAENQNQRPGNVYGLNETGGMLVAVTSAGSFGLDATAIEDNIVGSNGTGWRLLNHAKTISYASSATVRGRCYALTTDGYTNVDTETNAEAILADPMMSRAYGPRISAADFRTGRMYASELGPIVALDDTLSRSDVTDGQRTWWTSSYDTGAFAVRGVLQAHNGQEMLLCENGVFVVDGNFDGDIALTSGAPSQPTGIVFGVVPSTPADNRLVRHVHVAAAVGGAGYIGASVRGKRRRLVPKVDQDGITIGTDSWGTTTKRFTATPLAGARIDFSPADARATRDVCVEVAADGCLARVNRAVVVEFTDSSTQTPDNVGGT